MSEANKRQEGGTHYQTTGNPQHWDLVAMYGWDYFQSQITKYVMRWKSKHATAERRVEDLKKARHFLDKYIEVADVYDTGGGVAVVPVLQAVINVPQDGILPAHIAHRVWPTGWIGYTFEGSKEQRNLYRCAKCKAHFSTAPDELPYAVHEPECSALDAPQEEHAIGSMRMIDSGVPQGRGYVAQD